DGKNRTTGGELRKVPPWRVTATAGLHGADGSWTAGTRMTLVGGKADPGLGYVASRYQTVDVFGSWRLGDRAVANLAVNNLFDRDYRQYMNADPSPGRNVSASVTFTF